MLIALHNDKVLVEDRRAGVAPFVIGHVEGALVERADVLFPEQVAVQVERVEALGTEESDHTLAVGGGRGGGITVVWMTTDSRLHLGSDFLPEDLSAPFVETEDLELVLREIRAAIDLAGERILENGLRIVRDRAGDVDATAPDDWTRVTQARDQRAPCDVPVCLHVPRDGDAARFEDAGRLRPSEGWPVLGLGCGDKEDPDEPPRKAAGTVEARGAVIGKGHWCLSFETTQASFVGRVRAGPSRDPRESRSR